MTTTARTSPAPPAEAGPVRRVLSAAFLGLPALAVVAFGGQLLVTGWLDGRQDGSFHAQDLAWGSTEGILLFVGLVASSGTPVTGRPRSSRRSPSSLPCWRRWP